MDMGYSAAGVLHNSHHSPQFSDSQAKSSDKYARGVSMEEPIHVGDVVERLRKLYGVTTDQGLSEALGVPKTTISSWRTRNRAPYDACVEAVRKYRTSLDWLLFGEEAHGVRDEGPPPYLVSESPRTARITAFLRHWAATRGEDDQAWLEMQLARAVPEYAQWVASQGIG